MIKKICFFFLFFFILFKIKTKPCKNDHLIVKNDKQNYFFNIIITKFNNFRFKVPLHKKTKFLNNSQIFSSINRILFQNKACLFDINLFNILKNSYSIKILYNKLFQSFNSNNPFLVSMTIELMDLSRLFEVI